MTVPHNPLLAAQQMQGMAAKANNEKLATALTAMSVLMLTVMLAREAGILPLKNWQERELERRHDRGRER